MTVRHRRPVSTQATDLLLQLLAERGLSQGDLARAWQVSHGYVNQIVQGRTSITPRVACRLEASFGVSAEEWLQLEAADQLTLLRRQWAGEMARIRHVLR